MLFRIGVNLGDVIEEGARHTAQGSRWRILAFCLAGVLAVIAGVALWQFFLRPAPPADKVDLRKVAFPLPGKTSIAVLRF